jgi:transcription factor TFIIIB component B''
LWLLIMSSSTDVVSLVPRSSKKTSRKQRPGFRPVAKAKKKTSPAASSANEKINESLETEVATESVPPKEAEINASASVDEPVLDKEAAADTTGDDSEEKSGTTGDEPTSDKTSSNDSTMHTPTRKRASSPGRKAVRPSLLAERGASAQKKIDTAAPNESTPAESPSTSIATPAAASAATKPSSENSTASTRKKDTTASASAPLSPRRSTRKRKQMSHSSIKVGATREVISSAPTVRTAPRESEAALKEKQQDAAVAASASAVAAAAAAAAASTSMAIVPLISQDQATLERLRAENGTGSSLATFCSKFKVEKSKDEKGRGKRNKRNEDGNNQNETIVETNLAGAATNNQTTDAMDDGEMSTSEQAPAGVPVVQIVDGEIVLQESSLMLPTRRTVQEVEEEFQDNVVEEDAQLAIVQASYTSFLTKGDAAANGGKRRPTHWSLQETQKFYVALRQLGTDFGSMEAWFEGKRTRRQLSNKYKKELALNPNLVRELALNPKYKTDLGKWNAARALRMCCPAKKYNTNRFSFVIFRHCSLRCGN